MKAILKIYTVALLMVLQKTVICFECKDFYTIVEENTCEGTNYTFKPGIVPVISKTIPKYEIPYDDCTDTLTQDCFLQLSCDVIETSCESIVTSTVKTLETTIHEKERTPKTTTDIEYTENTPTAEYTPTKEYVSTKEYTPSTEYTTTEESTPTREYTEYETEAVTEVITYQTEKGVIEEKEFHTAFEETTCYDGGPIITINPLPTHRYIKTISSLAENCTDVYLLDNYLELSCEDIVMTCDKIGAKESLNSTPPTPNDNSISTATYILIAIGCVASVSLVSYAGYAVFQKIIDAIQSNTYHLPQ
ncbi:PREDICTED: uncharacterized protein LOC106103572 [Papilio polytes]|uniref:uncharacterized protein LOC106103572 n=1 Tax=Papilio polytes TaxID=76194 RepID=UPI000675EF1E|nr:PREDICTED: uncharacterized protein LOC106103572 [Papilio polytes]